MWSQGWDSMSSETPVPYSFLPGPDHTLLDDMSQPQRSSSIDSASESVRKRVCKACDRCRLKKSKCDGSSPCSRCKTDNAICVFGERKKSHDKVYPKGYVEMLEQQQGQLVAGLQEMYHRLLASQQWTGPVLSEATGHPLTHDILAALGLLEAKHDGSGETETFEEDCRQLQSKLFRAGAPSMRRKGSFSSDSERSQHANNFSTAMSTPDVAKAPIFKDSFSFSNSSTPAAQSPAPVKRHTHPPLQQLPHRSGQMPTHDPESFQQSWSMDAANINSNAIARSRSAAQPWQINVNADDVADIMSSESWMRANLQFDSAINGLSTYPSQFSNPFESVSPFQDMSSNGETMDIDFNRWIQVQP